MNSEKSSNYINRRAELVSSLGLKDVAPIETIKPSENAHKSVSSDSSRHGSSYASKAQSLRGTQSSANGSTRISSIRREGYAQSTTASRETRTSSRETRTSSVGSYSPDGSYSTSGKVYSRSNAYSAIPGNTLFATDGSSAYKPQTAPEEHREVKKEHKPNVFQLIYAYCAATDAIPKAVIVCLVITLALAICVPLVGSLSKAQAQNELNSINEQIKAANHRIAELNEAYLCSIDSDRASAAAVNFGMVRSAQNTPIHP